jgi:hypothetical protein
MTGKHIIHNENISILAISAYNHTDFNFMIICFYGIVFLNGYCYKKLGLIW